MRVWAKFLYKLTYLHIQAPANTKSPSKVYQSPQNREWLFAFLFRVSNTTTKKFIVFSCRCQWFEVGDCVRYVPAICWNQPDWSAFARQETETFYQIKVQQLVAQIQRNIPFVSEIVVNNNLQNHSPSTRNAERLRCDLISFCFTVWLEMKSNWISSNCIFV